MTIIRDRVRETNKTDWLASLERVQRELTEAIEAVRRAATELVDEPERDEARLLRAMEGRDLAAKAVGLAWSRCTRAGLKASWHRQPRAGEAPGMTQAHEAAGGGSNATASEATANDEPGSKSTLSKEPRWKANTAIDDTALGNEGSDLPPEVTSAIDASPESTQGFEHPPEANTAIDASAETTPGRESPPEANTTIDASAETTPGRESPPEATTNIEPRSRATVRKGSPATENSLKRLQESFGSQTPPSAPARVEIAVMTAHHAAHPFAEALGAPHPVRRPRHDFTELRRELRHMDRWLTLEKPDQQALLAYATARLRSIQDAEVHGLERSVSDEDLSGLFGQLTEWSKRHTPGFVHGLGRHHKPKGKTWHDDATATWKRPGLPELAPRRSPPVQSSDATGPSLTAIRYAIAKLGDTALRSLVLQALSHHEPSELATLLRGQAHRLKGDGRLRNLRRLIRDLDKQGGAPVSAEPPNPEVQLNRIRDKLGARAKHNKDADGQELRALLVKSLKVIRRDDPRLMKLLEDHPKALKGHPKLKGLRRALKDHLQRKRAAQQRSAPPSLPEGYPDDGWKHFDKTRGKTATIVGGAPRPKARDRIKEAFHFEDVEWIDPSQTGEVTSAASRIRHRSIDVVILLHRYTPHAIDDQLMPAIKESGAHWISVERGYGVSQVRAAMDRCWKHKVREASP